MSRPSRMTPIEPAAPRRVRFAPLPAWWPEAAVLLLAAITRFWRLEYHSIWFDEAVSLKWAGWAPADMWPITMQLVEEKHPPLYYLFLHGWQKLLAPFGPAQDDGWLRASGALLGLLTVLGLLLLVRRVGGRRVALAAGLLAALAPALVWYSQELRMFQPAATALVWGGLFLAAAWQCERVLPRLLLWLGLVACLAAAVYAYLFSALTLPAAGFTLLLLWWCDRRRVGRLIEGMAAFGLTAALVFPLARNAWAVNSAENTGAAPFADLAATLGRLLRTWSVWRPGWPAGLEVAVLAVFALLMLAGLLLPRRSRPAQLPERGWLALWVGIPVLLGNLMLAGNESVFAEDRYFLFVAPFALWAAGRGCVLLGEAVVARFPARGEPWLRAAPALAAALILLAALPVLWTPARYREQWRAAVAWLGAQAAQAPGQRAAVITHVDYTHLPAEWYLRQRFTFEQLPLYHPFGGALTPDQVETVIAPPLQGVENEGFDTLFLLQSHLDGLDDARLVEGWLAEHYPLFTEAYPPGIKLTAYTIRSQYDTLPPLIPGTVAPNAELAPGLRLAACEVTTPLVAAQNQALHPGPGWATVRLWWQRMGEVAPGLHSRVRLVNAAGVWGESVERPGSLWERQPPSSWPEGVFTREDRDVVLNAQTPPGAYTVEVRLLDAGGADVGEAVACGTVEVTR